MPMRSCTFAMINRGCFELATSPIDAVKGALMKGLELSTEHMPIKVNMGYGYGTGGMDAVKGALMKGLELSTEHMPIKVSMGYGYGGIDAVKERWWKD